MHWPFAYCRTNNDYLFLLHSFYDRLSKVRLLINALVMCSMWMEFNHHLWSFSCSFTTIRFSCKRNNSFDVTRMVIIWSWKFVFQMWHKAISCFFSQLVKFRHMPKIISINKHFTWLSSSNIKILVIYWQIHSRNFNCCSFVYISFFLFFLFFFESLSRSTFYWSKFIFSSPCFMHSLWCCLLLVSVIIIMLDK